jgi:hypothetical protein
MKVTAYKKVMKVVEEPKIVLELTVDEASAIALVFRTLNNISFSFKIEQYTENTRKVLGISDNLICDVDKLVGNGFIYDLFSDISLAVDDAR